MYSSFQKAIEETAKEHGPFLRTEAKFSPELLDEVRKIGADSYLVWTNTFFSTVILDPHKLAFATTLLDLTLQRVGSKEDEKYIADSWAFCLQLQASYLYLTLEESCRLIEYLEHRQKRIAELADGANGIILLRIGRGLLNRLNPVLHHVERGRLLRFMALCKGFGHPSRLNKRGKVYTDEKTEIDKHVTDFSPAYYVSMLAVLPSSRDDTKIDQLALQPLISELEQQHARLNPGEKVMYVPVRDWLLLTWDTISVTELLVLSLQTYMSFRSWDNGQEDNISLAARKSKQIISVLGSKYLNLIERTEDDWKRWKDAQCPKLTKNEATVPLKEDLSVKKLQLSSQPLLTFSNNTRLSSLLTADISLPEVTKKTKDEKQSQEEQIIMNDETTSLSYSQLRNTGWKSGFQYYGNKQAADLAEIRAKLDDPTLSKQEETEVEAKRARVSYEDTEVSKRIQSNSIKPLPY